jgi:hypothetical protein
MGMDISGAGSMSMETGQIVGLLCVEVVLF